LNFARQVAHSPQYAESTGCYLSWSPVYLIVIIWPKPGDIVEGICFRAIQKLGFAYSQSHEDLKKRIDTDIKEQLLPMNIAIAFLVKNLSNVAYNIQSSGGLSTRTKLDDFNDCFKEVVMKMNIPGKDNQYKEHLISGYFSVLNKCSAN
jgi:hypothetical protein